MKVVFFMWLLKNVILKSRGEVVVDIFGDYNHHHLFRSLIVYLIRYLVSHGISCHYGNFSDDASYE